jgi:hypothetical protein
MVSMKLAQRTSSTRLGAARRTIASAAKASIRQPQDEALGHRPLRVSRLTSVRCLLRRESASAVIAACRPLPRPPRSGSRSPCSAVPGAFPVLSATICAARSAADENSSALASGSRFGPGRRRPAPSRPAARSRSETRGRCSATRSYGGDRDVTAGGVADEAGAGPDLECDGTGQCAGVLARVAVPTARSAA